MTETFDFIAIVFGVVLSALVILNTVSNAMWSAYLAYKRWLIRRSIKGLVITPTLEELAKYSVQIPQKKTYEEWKENRIGILYIMYNKEKQNNIAYRRILLVAIMFFFFFVYIIFNLIRIPFK